MGGKTTDMNGELCPDYSVCPVTCGPEEVLCPGYLDEQGCKNPDMCIPMPLNIDGELCPVHCPVTCGPEEAFCPGGIDCLGCMMADTCTLDECPEPVECLAG